MRLNTSRHRRSEIHLSETQPLSRPEVLTSPVTDSLVETSGSGPRFRIRNCRCSRAVTGSRKRVAELLSDRSSAPAAGGSGWFGTRSNHPLNFFTNDSTPQATLSAAGNFGIGTSAPTAKLEIQNVGSGQTGLYAESASGRAIWGKSVGSRGVYGESSSLEGVFGISGNGCRSCRSEHGPIRERTAKARLATLSPS
jgi:hypothetical protein